MTLVVSQPKRGMAKAKAADRKQGGGEPSYDPAEEEEDLPLPDEEEEETEPGSPEEADNRRITLEAAKALRGESKNPDEAIQEYLEVFGRERLEELRSMVTDEEPEEGAEGEQGMVQMASGGRLVDGPGHGMDDRISAKAGEQPVLLSDGEFVIPADVVSHLGDGSTKAGVRALEGMMHRVRRAKTGTHKQAGKLDHKKVMPR